MQWKDIEPNIRKDRQTTIYIRGLKKRIAVLEQKFLSIRECSDLFDRGVQISGGDTHGGIGTRMKRRIDALEAKLLVIRELSSMSAANAQKGGDTSRRQVVESRIRRNGATVTAAECGPHANLAVDRANEGFQAEGRTE